MNTTPEIVYEDLQGYLKCYVVGNQVVIDSSLPQEEKERILKLFTEEGDVGAQR